MTNGVQMGSRIPREGYVRFRERSVQTCRSNAERRYFPTLLRCRSTDLQYAERIPGQYHNQN